jgi:predicted MFS family arabinose efflux permease
MGLLTVAFGTSSVAPALVAAAFVLGVAAQGAKLVTDTAVQTECDDDHRGRAFSVYDMAFNVCYVIGLLAGAAALPPNGKSYAVLVALALVYALIAAGYALAAGRWARRSASPPPLVTAG